MDLLQSDKAKIRILMTILRSGEMTLNKLRGEIGLVNFVSVKRACLFLEHLGLLSLESKPAGNRRYVWVRLTKLGEDVARALR